MTMTLTEKLKALKDAGFTIGFVNPRDAHESKSVRSVDVHGFQYDSAERPFVILDGIAKGEDSAGQSTTLDRSNFRSLLRAYPGVFITVGYSNVDVLGFVVQSTSDEVVNVVVSLTDGYAAFDENDWSALESDEIGEAFDRYLWFDVNGRISPETQDIALLFSQDEICDSFYETMSSDHYYPEHTGIEVAWDDSEVIRLMEAALYALAANLIPATVDTAELF